MRINFSLCQVTLAIALFLNPLPAIVAQTATSGEMVSPTTGINYTRLQNFLAQQNWRQASFSFSTQFRIFIETGNRPGRLVAIENFQTFGDRIGWRKGGDWIIFKENLNYTLNAPVGHLPAPRDEYQIAGGRLEYTTLAQRLVTCNIVSLGQSKQ